MHLGASSERKMVGMLAENYEILVRSPDAERVFAGSPALARLPSGRLICTYEWFRGYPLKEKVPNQCETLISDDRGHSWRRTASTDLMWASPFVVDETVYLVGNCRGTREIAIVRSDDGAQTWSSISILFQGRYTNAPTGVARVGSTLYRAFETCPPGNGNWQSLMVAGDTTEDLLRASAWRMSNHLPYPGTPTSLKHGGDAQGIYPVSSSHGIPEDGWLEGNAVVVSGEVRNILRVRMQGEATAGMCAVCALEDDGNALVHRFVQFYPMPGGQCKFHIIHDDPSGCFWTAATVPTDTWQPPQPLWARGFKGSPGNERRVLVLLYSRDALNWFQAGFVATSADPLESFSYASLWVLGDELLIVARSSIGGKNQHDTNAITLHRIESFRSLVPAMFIPTQGDTR
jgi:hypothetical protein